MIRVLFLCHGNICRSPMAEFMFKKMIVDLEIDHLFYVESMALSSEELGNDIYYKAKNCLIKHNVPFTKRKAKQFKKDDYEKFDYIFIMDDFNKYLINKFIDDEEHKISFLKYEISDPWYNDNFEETYKDIEEGLKLFIEKLKKENKI